MTFHDLAATVLKESDVPMTVNEIWEQAVKKGLDRLLSTKGKTPLSTLGSRLYVLAEEPESVFKAIGQRPKRFLLKNKEYQNLQAYESGEIQERIEESSLKKKDGGFLEKDLHPFLSFFAHWNMGRCYMKTIIHQKSNKGEYADWIHPDMVGCIFINQSWHKSVMHLNKSLGSPAVKLISFELKRQVNIANLREYFFQTVSNSSWANEGYLVAAEFQENPDFLKELERLSNSFGIGVIRLDIEDPNASRVLFTARYKDQLDWETINKLTMNTDFTKFLDRIKTDVGSDEVRDEWYDKVLTEEELLGSVRSRKKSKE
jgi:hypothetical protein